MTYVWVWRMGCGVTCHIRVVCGVWCGVWCVVCAVWRVWRVWRVACRIYGPSRGDRVAPTSRFASSHAQTVICFFWGRALPWRQYLAAFPQLPLVCIAGDPAAEGMDCATEPRGGALDGKTGWRVCATSPVRAVHRSAVLSLYERVSDHRSLAEHMDPHAAEVGIASEMYRYLEARGFAPSMTGRAGGLLGVHKLLTEHTYIP